MRIGLFGGTFNPVHTGHLRAALEVREAFALDEIHLIPSAIPPHKDPGGIAPARQRLAMVRAAAEDQEGFVVSDVELQRRGPSYSVDTVAEYRRSLPQDGRLFLIIGGDAFKEIHTWKSYRRLFEQVAFIVMVRPGGQPRATAAVLEEIGHCLHRHVDAGYRLQAQRPRFVHDSLQPVAVTEVTRLQISATRIRSLIAAGRSIRYLVPDTVMDYIRRQGLYR